MNCPKCSYPNPQGVTYCQMCYEVFNRSAADRYLHAQRRARRQKESGSPPPAKETFREAPSISFPHVRNFLSQIDWAGMANRSIWILIDFFRTYYKELGMGAGLLTLGGLAFYFTSPAQRLSMFGSRLEYVYSTRKSVTYLIGTHTDLKSWSERDARLDTPLETSQRDEMGNVTVTATTLQKKSQKILFQPTEWIVNQSGQISQSIPLSHPSLKPCAVILKQGKIVNRTMTPTTRLGRALAFLAPRWPLGAQHTGSQWDEPVEWVQTLGDWKIQWKGKLHWKIDGVESWDKVNCLHLRYTAEVQPSLWESPDWARGGVHRVTYQGTAIGDVCFDRNQHQIFSNDFLQDGMLTIPIDNIYRIPPELRVGRTPRRHWGQNVSPEQGTIILQMKNRLGIHKS